MALGLGLDADWFQVNLTADPTRAVPHLPLPAGGGGSRDAGLGRRRAHRLRPAHASCGRTSTGGLEVHAPPAGSRFRPIPGTFVCNLGDMLDRMTGGRYRSTPHRVRNRGDVDRLVVPVLLRPGVGRRGAAARPSMATAPAEARRHRWDGEDVLAFDGTYGEYLLAKVGRVFPDLGDDVLPG